jgi:Permeases of the drug/metabolite transporter (DMT) superfamily
MTASPTTSHRPLYDNPYVVLTIAALAWSGNTIAGRLAVGQVSPMALTCLRWAGVCLVLAFTARGELRAAWPALRARPGFVVAMGALGFTAFNALYYVAAHYTSAVNIGILQGAIPLLVFLFALLLHGTAVTPMQILATVVGLSGVAVIAVKGDLSTLADLSFNFGDLLMLGACIVYAVYTALLPNRPKVSGFAFFSVLAIVALVTSLPLLGVEIAQGGLQWPTPAGWVVVAYTVLFPSILSQIMFMRGVELIGPGRAGVFVNLIPVFSAILAIILLGEDFHGYHAAALALVLGGIFFAERSKRR